MQLFDLLRFTVQLIDFINNLLAPVEGFNRYQIFCEKKWRAGVEPGPLRFENLELPLRYTLLSVGLAAKALKYKYFSSLRHRFLFTNRCLRNFSNPARCSPKVPGGIITRYLWGTLGTGWFQTGALGLQRHRLILSPGTLGL